MIDAQWPGLSRLARVAGNGALKENIPPDTVDFAKSALSKLAEFRQTGTLTGELPSVEQIRKFKDRLGIRD